MSLRTSLKSRHSQDMSHGPRSGPKEETWNPKIHTTSRKIDAFNIAKYSWSKPYFVEG